jgi:serine/threonine protein kinase
MSQTIPSNRPAHLDPTAAADGGTTSLCMDLHLQPAQQDDEIGRLGNYRVLRMLAEGGMGKVYEAEDFTLNRLVALKVIRPNLERSLPGATERFLREARAMASIKHDNLVTVYATGREADTVYLAMELLQGETLETRLDRSGALPWTEVVRIGREIALGLSAVHGRGLIHRDIKPANLWLEAPTGRVKILDFGLVRTARGEDGLTQVGMIVGTPAYLSPEQVRAEEFDHRADLFSLGCVLYRMCTNRIPFPADTPTGQLRAVSTDEALAIADINPSVPTELADLIMQLLDKDPAGRPSTAADVAERLQKVKRGQTEARRKAKGETAAKARKTRVSAAAKRQPTGPSRWVWVAIASSAAAIGVTLPVAVVVALKKADRPNAPEPRPVAEQPAAASPPVVPQQPVKEYLADLKHASAAGWPLRGPLPPGLNGPLYVRGQLAAHGILMHPGFPPEPPPSITYRLDKKYRRLSGAVGFNFTAPPETPPTTFVVSANGKSVWTTPHPLNRNDQSEPFDVDVSAADTLTLELRPWGEPRGCHAVWVDPLLTK